MRLELACLEVTAGGNDSDDDECEYDDEDEDDGDGDDDECEYDDEDDANDDDSIPETATLEIATGEMSELIPTVFHSRWPANMFIITIIAPP